MKIQAVLCVVLFVSGYNLVNAASTADGNFLLLYIFMSN